MPTPMGTRTWPSALGVVTGFVTLKSPKRSRSSPVARVLRVSLMKRKLVIRGHPSRGNKFLGRCGGVNRQQEVVPQLTERPPRDPSW
jgi:hypothetical protein